MKILLGFYYGIGDFVSVIPVVRELVKKYNITVAIGEQNKGIVKLLDIPETVNIVYFPLFSLRNIPKIKVFTSLLKYERFDTVLVSPHAQDAVTSWKIPLMLKYIASKHTKIIGSDGDKNAFLYDIKIPIDKSIPLMQREIDFIQLTRLINLNSYIDTSNIFKVTKKQATNKIVIHPGASKPLKAWRLQEYINLVELITSKTNNTILFIGLENELEELKKTLFNYDKITFFSGSFQEVIEQTLDAKAIITMDSGFGHIASSLGLNHYVLIGSANPNYIKPIFKNTTVIYQKKLSCQPCNGHHCKIGYNYCMDLITADYLFEQIQKEINNETNNTK